MSTSPLSLDHIIIPRISGSKILDVGCGYGKWGFLLKKYFWNTQDGSQKTEPFVAGLDLYFPNLERLTRHKIYDLLVHGKASRLPFPDKSFDTVLAIEIIEHMTEEDGWQALKEFERVASNCVIISTPNKKCLREGIEDMTGYNPHEAHLSWWKRKTFRNLGYRCYGMGLKLWPSRFFGMTEFAYASYRMPALSDTLICVKQMNDGNSK